MKKVAADVLSAPSLTAGEIKAFRAAKILAAEGRLIKVIEQKQGVSASEENAIKAYYEKLDKKAFQANIDSQAKLDRELKRAGL